MVREPVLRAHSYRQPHPKTELERDGYAVACKAALSRFDSCQRLLEQKWSERTDSAFLLLTSTFHPSCGPTVKTPVRHTGNDDSPAFAGLCLRRFGVRTSM